jgi:hypothetical protein
VYSESTDVDSTPSNDTFPFSFLSTFFVNNVQYSAELETVPVGKDVDDIIAFCSRAKFLEFSWRNWE